MPVALERELKKKVANKKMSKERKDAYVYGTLRKTGWKPKRELEKEKNLSAKLDDLIEFDWKKNLNKWSKLKRNKLALGGGTALATGTAGALAMNRVASGQAFFNKRLDDLIEFKVEIPGVPGLSYSASRDPEQRLKDRMEMAGSAAKVAGWSGVAAAGGVGAYQFHKHGKDLLTNMRKSFEGMARTGPALETLEKRTKHLETFLKPEGPVPKGVGFVTRQKGKLAKLGKLARFLSRHPNIANAMGRVLSDPSEAIEFERLRLMKNAQKIFESPEETIEFASIPSTWVGGALKTAGTFESSVARQYGKKLVDIPEKTRFRLSQMVGGIKKPTVSMPTKSYYPGSNAKPAFLSERGSRVGDWGFSSKSKPIEFAKINVPDNLGPEIQYLIDKHAIKHGIIDPEKAVEDWHRHLRVQALVDHHQEQYARKYKEHGLKSKERLIQFDASILGPWQGSKGHTSKIDQLEFPAGLSPAAALQMPLPELMKLLNQRNLQQQVFSSRDRVVQLNARIDSLIEFQVFQAVKNLFGKIGKFGEEAGQAGARGYMTRGASAFNAPGAATQAASGKPGAFFDYLRQNVSPGSEAATGTAGSIMAKRAAAAPPGIPTTTPGMGHAGPFASISGSPPKPGYAGPFASMSGSGAAAAPGAAAAAAPTTASQAVSAVDDLSKEIGKDVSNRTASSLPSKGTKANGAKGWWENQSTKKKLAYGLGAGAVAGGAGGYLLGRGDDRNMSAWLDDIITFDSRPRNPLGEFTGQEGGPNPNSMATTYKSSIATGAAGGVAAGATGFGIKALLDKLRKAKKK